MTNIVNLASVKKQKNKEQLDQSYQYILEGLISNMMDQGIEFDNRTEKAMVPMLKILESILYKQNGVDHSHTMSVDRFIEMAFEEKND